jgi:acetolactate synthase-1/2/3 large subunit
VERLPYFPEQASEALAPLSDLVLVGTTEPVAFFAYPGLPSRLAPEGCRIHVLARPEEDAEAGLEALAEALGAPRGTRTATSPPRPGPAAGALDATALGRTLAALQPDHAIVVDEGATSGLPYYLHSAAAPPHSFLTLTGGAIGQGLPCATGAALACPDRRVIALQADGSGMYTLQALWTQAREGLDVTTVLCANRSYRILQVELGRAGIAEPGPKAHALTDLTHPELDWCSLARGLGVPADRVETGDGLARALAASFAEPGPRLIEAML